MAIDDPLDAAEQQIAAEVRASSPLAKYIPDIAVLSGFIPSGIFGMDFVKNGLKAAGLYVSRLQADRRQCLMDALAEELRRVRAKLEHLDEAHQRFCREEWVPLVIDGLQKAEQTISQDRVRRIAAILGHAIEAGPAKPASTAEEMMRIAMLLSDQEVLILRTLHDGQIATYNPHQGRVSREEVNDFWRLTDPGHRSYGEPEHKTLRQFPAGKLNGICAKLQSLGLVAQVERNNFKLGPDVVPYGILSNTVEFVEYVRSTF